MLDPETEIGGYRLGQVLGRGGMGIVYQAEHLTLGRQVAIKVVLPELAADEGFRQRFLREARLAASMDHPNVLPVLDAGEQDGRLYLVMRHVRGTDLAATLRSDPLDIDVTVAILTQVAEALDAAHELGMVHRDVKPANILIERGTGRRGADRVFLSDFGLTKRLDSTSKLTMHGLVVGTVAYASPEQLRAQPVDGRSDIYSLTCVAVECLVGEPPFVRDTDAQTITAHLMDPPPAVSNMRAGLPSAVDAAIAWGLAKRAEDRPDTCRALVDALGRALDPIFSGAGDTIAAPPPPPVGQLNGLPPPQGPPAPDPGPPPPESPAPGLLPPPRPDAPPPIGEVPDRPAWVPPHVRDASRPGAGPIEPRAVTWDPRWSRPPSEEGQAVALPQVPGVEIDLLGTSHFWGYAPGREEFGIWRMGETEPFARFPGTNRGLSRGLEQFLRLEPDAIEVADELPTIPGVEVDMVGANHVWGYEPRRGEFGIWRTGERDPVARFPGTDEGLQEGLDAFLQLEPDATEVDDRTPEVAGVEWVVQGGTYLLGYSREAASYGIWARGQNAPLERYPVTDSGWQDVIGRFAILEPSAARSMLTNPG